nr:PIN domain-containing protein [Thermococcus sp.]
MRCSTVPKEELRPYLPGAREITPDPKDVPYVAFALAFNVPLATGDKALRKGLKGARFK